MQSATGGGADVFGEQQPGQGDVLVLSEVAELVINGDASARPPSGAPLRDRRRATCTRAATAGMGRVDGE